MDLFNFKFAVTIIQIQFTFFIVASGCVLLSHCVCHVCVLFMYIRM